MSWIRLAGLFLVELIKGAASVAWLAVQPTIRVQQRVVEFPITLASDAQITLLANLITLTPGTLSLDISDDRRTLYVHALDARSSELLIGDIAAGFETAILRAVR